MLSRAATMPCAQLSPCHSARSVCDQLVVAQAFAAIWAQQLELLARVHRSTAAALGYCTPCHCDFSHSALVPQFSRFSFSRLAPEFPVVVLTGELVVCFGARSTHTRAMAKREDLNEPQLLAVCAAQGSTNLCAADFRSPQRRQQRAAGRTACSRREQLRQNPKFATVPRRDARHGK